MKKGFTMKLAFIFLVFSNSVFGGVLSDEYKDLMSKAGNGDSISQYNLGMWYIRHQRNYNEALIWYEKAANQHNLKAITSLTTIYADRLEYIKAAKWCHKAIELNNPIRSCGKSLVISELIHEADNGNTESQYQLALKYYDEESDHLGRSYATIRNKDKAQKEALSWYKKAAENGHVKSQFILGKIYSSVGGDPERAKQAHFWYEKSAKQDYAPAQFAMVEAVRNRLQNKMPSRGWLASIIYYLQIILPQDNAGAEKWLRKAAENGHAEAQFQLAWSYHGHGVPKDLKQAIKWYEKAAESGSQKAQNTLGSMYYSGRQVEKNYTKAFNWHLKASKQDGYTNSRFRLIQMYENGIGVEKDYIMAYAWMKVDSNFVSASTRDSIVKKMTPQQIVQGEGIFKKLKNEKSEKNEESYRRYFQDPHQEYIKKYFPD